MNKQLTERKEQLQRYMIIEEIQDNQRTTFEYNLDFEGKDLKEYRKLNGLTQKELATLLKCANTTICNNERGNRAIPKDRQIRFYNLVNGIPDVKEEPYPESEFKEVLENYKYKKGRREFEQMLMKYKSHEYRWAVVFHETDTHLPDFIKFNKVKQYMGISDSHLRRCLLYGFNYSRPTRQAA